MNINSSLLKMTSALTLFLTVVTPPLMAEVKCKQLSSISVMNIPVENAVSGVFKGAFNYSAIALPDLKEGLLISLAYPEEENPNENPVGILTGASLFYETEEFDRETIADILDDLGLDIDYPGFVDQRSVLEFCLEKPEKLPEALRLVSQVFLHPTLSDIAIERARNRLIETSSFTEEEIHALRSVESDEVRNYYSDTLRTRLPTLTILQPEAFDLETTCKALKETFGEPFSVAYHDSISGDLSTPLLQNIELSSDNSSYIVDGKIWMDPPGRFDRESYGKKWAAVLLTLGVASLGGAAVIFAPLALISFPCFLPGFYLLFSSYPNDPQYIERMRETDLKKGMAFSYNKNRAGLTLTPFERRVLFLDEMVNKPETLPKLPILLITETYRLNDPVVVQMFSYEEYDLLKGIRSDFIHQKNHFSRISDALEKELAGVLAPYALIRDSVISQARFEQGNNQFIIREKELKKEKEEAVAAFEAKTIGNPIKPEEKAKQIAMIKKSYDAILKDPTFVLNVEIAKNSLDQIEKEALATYLHQAEQCKQSIRYHERSIGFREEKESLTYTYTQLLIDRLKQFPVYEPSISDYLDLRVVK